MRKIIFDLDNTLIMHKEKYLKYYVKALEEFGYDANMDEAKKLYKSIGDYEKICNQYDYDGLMTFVNADLGTNYDVKLLERLNYYIGEYWYEMDEDAIAIIEHLANKYELYVLTNWFGFVAEKRLAKAGVLKYFKEVVGGDKVPTKPQKESFLYFTKDCDVSECLMIGDSVETDYVGATNVQMPVILYDYKNIYDDSYRRINSLIELKKIL